MKLKKLVSAIYILIFALCLSVTGKAQSGAIQLSSGITVAIKTESIPPNGNDSLGNIYSSGSGYTDNVVHRVTIDQKNKIYFGYDLSAEKIGESGKFKVEIKPLSKSPDKLFGRSATDYSGFTAKALPKYPEAITLNDGDSITLEILENRQTGSKILDIIKITSEKKNFGSFFSEREDAKDFTVDDVIMKIEKPEISVNGQKTIHNSSASGNMVWFYMPGKGRFIFSFRPQSEFNFQKNGMILDNKIIFEHNGEKYELLNKSPVLSSGGKWNLWVMFDQKYQPENPDSSNSYVFGATDKAKNLFDFK